MANLMFRLKWEPSGYSAAQQGLGLEFISPWMPQSRLLLHLAEDSQHFYSWIQVKMTTHQLTQEKQIHLTKEG